MSNPVTLPTPLHDRLLDTAKEAARALKSAEWALAEERKNSVGLRDRLAALMRDTKDVSILQLRLAEETRRRERAEKALEDIRRQIHAATQNHRGEP